MNWDQTIISERELDAYRKSTNGRRLPSLIGALVEQQKQSWPLLAEGYGALQQVETKRFQVEESQVVVQHNPRRIKSTSASVDRASVEARGCFLCPERLPSEEKGIAYGSDLVILCNPFPILDSHLSIVHRRHIPQRIEANLHNLLGLACDLGPEFFVLYNGPECGASAPDHLHFQACSRSLLPIYSDLGIEEAASHCQQCEQTGDGFELFTLENCGRAVVVYRGNRSDEIAMWVERTLARLQLGALYPEPMINIICTYDRGMWTLLLFPRSRHRPACFYSEADDRLLVSPGAIDMAGVIVVPERAHFDRISAEDVSRIYEEVSADVEAINLLIEQICESSAEEELLGGWA